jgi:outer membrane biosynthesis protein TonB
VKPTTPFTVGPPIERGRNWGALSTSAALHVVVILWLIFRPASARSLPTIERNPGEDRQDIALAPPANPAPQAAPQPEQPQPQAQPEQPQPEQQRPEPPKKATPLGPDSKNPDALVPKEAGPEKPRVDPDQMDVNKPEPPTKVETPPAEPEVAPTAAPKGVRRIATASDMVNNLMAKGERLDPNGRPRDILDEGTRKATSTMAAAAGPMGRVGPTQPDNRDWRPSFPEAAGRCVEIPDLGKNPDGTPVLATVIGRVLADDRRSPLAGAHLQIVGTPFSTFSNGNGEYRLEFDPKLLERCRVQYVRVAREGFGGELLTLSIGERITSDDVVLRRR